MNAMDKVIGYEHIKKELKKVLDVMKNTEKYKKMGVKIPHGILLDGVPGVGKTLLASCFVEESGRKPYILRKNKPDGEFVDCIRETFDKAMQDTPSIVFLDDMDKFANEDMAHLDAEEYVTIQACIDDIKEKDVFVIATTNEKRSLPRSLVRSGRFDYIFTLEVPEGEDAEKIISFYLKDKNVEKDIDAEEISRFCRGNSCADLEKAVNNAGLCAGYDGRDKISQSDMIRSCLKVFYRIDNDEPANETLIKRRAIHEAGHAVVAEILDPGSVDFVAVSGRKDNRVGGVVSRKRNEEFDESFKEQEIAILISLAGKASTEVVLGEIDMGANRDMHKAFDLTRVLLDNNTAYDFGSWCHGEETSQMVYDNLDRATAFEITRYYQKVKQMIIENRTFLDEVINNLCKNRTISYKDIRIIKDGIVD